MRHNRVIHVFVDDAMVLLHHIAGDPKVEIDDIDDLLWVVDLAEPGNPTDVGKEDTHHLTDAIQLPIPRLEKVSKSCRGR